MAVARSIADTVARPIPITAPARRLRLLDALVLAGADLIALATEGLAAHDRSREHDAGCDAAVETIDVLAWRIAQLADTTGDALTLSLAGQIRRECQQYRVRDAAEDGSAGVLASALRKIVGITRGLNQSLERELRKRGGAR